MLERIFNIFNDEAEDRRAKEDWARSEKIADLKEKTGVSARLLETFSNKKIDAYFNHISEGASMDRAFNVDMTRLVIKGTVVSAAAVLWALPALGIVPTVPMLLAIGAAVGILGYTRETQNKVEGRYSRVREEITADSVAAPEDMKPG